MIADQQYIVHLKGQMTKKRQKKKKKKIRCLSVHFLMTSRISFCFVFFFVWFCFVFCFVLFCFVFFFFSKRISFCLIHYIVDKFLPNGSLFCVSCNKEMLVAENNSQFLPQFVHVISYEWWRCEPIILFLSLTTHHVNHFVVHFSK